MKQLLNLSVMLFASVVLFAQTSVKPNLTSTKTNLSVSTNTESDDYKAQIDALASQNAKLKKQLAAMLNPSQAELNAKFIAAMEESNKILANYFKKPSSGVVNTAITSSNSTNNSQVLNDIKGFSKEITSLPVSLFEFNNKSYVSINNENLFSGSQLTENGNKLITILSKFINSNPKYTLTIERNELSSTKSKVIEEANSNLESIKNEISKLIRNSENKVFVSQFFSSNKKGKNSEQLKSENYSFIISSN